MRKHENMDFTKLVRNGDPSLECSLIYYPHLILHSFHWYNQIEEVKHLPAEDKFKLPYSDGPSNYARALCHMPSLRSLKLADNYLQDEDFYTTMAAEAKESQVNTVHYA